MLRILGIAILALAAGGGYYGYTNYFQRNHGDDQRRDCRRPSPKPSTAPAPSSPRAGPRWCRCSGAGWSSSARCEGQTVKAGQVLGRQDDAEERNALDQMQISSQQAQRDLIARREGSHQERRRAERIRAALDPGSRNTKSRIAAQQVRIDRCVLRAPLDGMVLRRDGEVGEIAGPTDVLFWVGPPLPMQVVAEVNEEEINRIAVRPEGVSAQRGVSGTGAARQRLADHAQGRPDPQDLPRLSACCRRTRRCGSACRSRPTSSSARSRRPSSCRPRRSRATAVQIVDDGQHRARARSRVGIRGSRNVEIIGDVVAGHGRALACPPRSCRRHAGSHRQQPDQGRGAGADERHPVDVSPIAATPEARRVLRLRVADGHHGRPRIRTMR